MGTGRGVVTAVKGWVTSEYTTMLHLYHCSEHVRPMITSCLHSRKAPNEGDLIMCRHVAQMLHLR